MRRVDFGAGAMATLTFVVGCDVSHNIELATTIDAGNFEGKPCTTGTQCGDGGFFCAQTCDPQSGGPTIGTCELTPSECDAAFDPVCSCDSKTVYFNTCLAFRAHAILAQPSASFCGFQGCGDPTNLTNASSCPTGEACLRLYVVPTNLAPYACFFQNQTGVFPPQPGSSQGCWVLPDSGVCSSHQPKSLIQCGSPVPPGPCIDLCTAISSDAAAVVDTVLCQQ